MSYTSFELGGFAASAEAPTSGRFKVSCTVKNTGERAGSEVVQLYTHFLDAHVTRPNKQLAGFKRVDLEDMEFVVEPGRLNVMLGTSAHDLAWSGTLSLTGEKVPVLGKRSYTSQATVG